MRNMTEAKRALITGITGQDGSYLAEFLLQKGYEVSGLVRRSSNDPLERILDLHLGHKIKLMHGSLRDLNAVRRVMEKVVPDEVYNLAAQSHVGISFECPEETEDINYYGVGRVVIEALKVNPQVHIYQASTSEMFGSSTPPQNEHTPFNPVSPYAKAKLRAHEDYVVGYREHHGAHISSGILFNHESPRRGKNFVTRKITHSLAKIKLGLQDSMELGNLDAKRDWGFAGDYVEAMWLMLQQETPEDYVIATGISHSVRDFFTSAASALGMIVTWEGTGTDEVAKDQDGKTILRINKEFYRPAEVSSLCGDSSKAKEKLHWQAETTFDELIHMMTETDLKELTARTK
jgi:GDPmannose 4,6-dehydratase